MSVAKTFLLYQAYGAEAILEECLWSLLSLSRCTAPANMPLVVIYTDNPAWFKAWKMPFEVQYELLDAERIQAWRGPQQFVHRLKVEMILDALQRYQLPLLYLDTDTEFLQSPAPLLAAIAGGSHYMHVCEGKLSEPVQPVRNKLLSFLNRHPGVSVGKQPISGDTLMWNAGALGLSPQDAPLVQQVLALTDSLYSRYPKHVIEQFAFSVVLQEAQPLHSAAPWVLHYWNFKEWRLWLASFFREWKGADWHTLEASSRHLQLHVALQEKAGFYQRRSLWGKMVKEKWQPQLPDWQKLRQQ